MNDKKDASNELGNYVIPGIQHKYDGTLMVFVSKKCAEICPWCFRARLFDNGSYNDDAIVDPKQLHDYLSKMEKNRRPIHSVLLSGGDAMLAEENYISEIFNVLQKFEIGSIRLASRALVLNPFDYDEILVKAMSKSITKVYVVLHIVKAKEAYNVQPSVLGFGKRITFLSQTPLLNGVNNDQGKFDLLMHSINEIGINPYYLFQCRAIEGNEKFSTTFEEGLNLLNNYKRNSSGVDQRIRYVMSADIGKIEIVGKTQNNKILFKNHRMKDSSITGKMFNGPSDAVWLQGGKFMFLENGKYI